MLANYNYVKNDIKKSCLCRFSALFKMFRIFLHFIALAYLVVNYFFVLYLRIISIV